MFITEANGSVSRKLTDRVRPIREQLEHRLRLLDGAEDFAFLIYYVPDDAGWPDGPGYDDAKYSQEYLQSAGSADAMTIELRRREEDGEYHQYAVGRPGGDGGAPPVEIRYAEHALTAPASEVFTAETAAPVYYHYFQTRTVPDDLVLRELDLA